MESLILFTYNNTSHVFFAFFPFDYLIIAGIICWLQNPHRLIERFLTCKSRLRFLSSSATPTRFLILF